jgi:hypothetical protein
MPLHKGQRVFILVAVSACMFACSAKKPAGQGSARGGFSSFDAATPTLTLVQADLLPGTTGVDAATAAVTLKTLDVSTQGTILDLLTANATFVSDDGQTLAAIPSFTAVKMPPLGITVSVTPSTGLKADHWYTFVLNQNSALQLSNGKTPADLAARTPSVWKSDFFTGSAPHLTRIQIPQGAKDGAYVHVIFSEPIALAQLAMSSLLTVDGTPVGNCIVQGGKCASSLAGAVAEEFDMVPVGPLGNFTSMTVAVPGTVRGSSRSVSEAVGFSANHFTVTTATSGVVSALIARSDWKPCQQGASLCWQAHNN